MGNNARNFSSFFVMFTAGATVALTGCSNSGGFGISEHASSQSAAAASSNSAQQITRLEPKLSKQHFITKTFKDAATVSPTGPCEPFKSACTAAGFKLSGATAGDRLIADCMIPLLKNGSATSKTAGLTAQVPANGDSASCATHIHKGVQPTTGLKSATVPTYDDAISAVASSQSVEKANVRSK